MKKGSQLIFLALFLFAITLISAEQMTFGTFGQNDCIDLKVGCGNCTYLNITSIQYPNGTNINLEASTTKQGTDYVYNTCNQTSALGEYYVNFHGDVDGVETADGANYYVTESGDRFDQSQAIMLLGQFGLIALFFFIGNSFDKQKWKLKSFFQMMSMLMGIVLLNSIRILIGTSTNLAKMGTIGLVIGITALSFMTLYILILYTIEMFNYFKKKNRSQWDVGGDFGYA